MAGITNVKEAIVAAAALFKAIKAVSADGLQLADVATIFDQYQNDPVFAKKLEDGLLGWELLATELADISLFEGLDLLKTLSNEFKK